MATMKMRANLVTVMFSFGTRRNIRCHTHVYYCISLCLFIGSHIEKKHLTRNIHQKWMCATHWWPSRIWFCLPAYGLRWPRRGMGVAHFCDGILLGMYQLNTSDVVYSNWHKFSWWDSIQQPLALLQRKRHHLRLSITWMWIRQPI